MAGLGFAVRLDKPVEFIGRAALRAAREAGPPPRRLRCLVLDDPRSIALGNEPVRVDGRVVGPGHVGRLRLRGRTQHRLRLPAAATAALGTRVEVDVFGTWVGRGRVPRAALRSGQRADPGVTGPAGPGRSPASARRGAPACGARAARPSSRGWLELALAMCDEADGMALAGFRRELEITPSRTAAWSRRSTRPSNAACASGSWPPIPTTGSSARRRARRARRGRCAGTWTPSTGPTTSSAGCPCSARSSASSATARCRSAWSPRPALRQRWYAWRGGGAWVTGSPGAPGPGPRRIHVSAVARLEDAQLVYSSPTDIETGGARLPRRSSAAPGATAASATSGATRSWPKGPRRR